MLKLRAAPYRFVTEYNVETGKMSLTFGAGETQTFDGDLIPDLGELSIPLYGKDYFTDFAIDPQNFLKTRTLGLSPTNTTLTIKYRVGGGLSTNAGSNTIRSVVQSVFTVGDSSLNAAIVRDVRNSLEVVNPRPVVGGLDEKSIEEVKQLVSANFAAQNRMVGITDFTVRALSMPSRYGSIFRAYARLNPLNKNTIDLHILTKDSSGYVVAPTDDLAQNLKKYLNNFRMVTDVINIAHGEVINVGVRFSVLTNPVSVSSEVLADCLLALKEFFAIDKWQINQPINMTKMYKLISDVPGVLSLISLNFTNLTGTQEGRAYSNASYNILENTANGILYCKENAIFEVKYPNVDIVGTAK